MSDEDKAEFATGVVLTGVTLRGGVRGAPRGERVGAAERVGATCSFGPSTPVATASGGVAISRVAVDDAVQTTDPTTGKTADHRVTAVMVHVDPVIEDLTIGGETIETTPNHRFLTADRGWVQAGDLRAGEPVRKLDGSTAPVFGYTLRVTPQPMWDLTVAGFTRSR